MCANTQHTTQGRYRERSVDVGAGGDEDGRDLVAVGDGARNQERSRNRLRSRTNSKCMVTLCQGSREQDNTTRLREVMIDSPKPG